MQIKFLINVLLIYTISCSYYSKIMERKKFNNNTINIDEQSLNNQTKSIFTIVLKNHKDVQYIGDIYIGSPLSKLREVTFYGFLLQIVMIVEKKLIDIIQNYQQLLQKRINNFQL